MKARAECTALIAAGGARINRLPTDKPHARLRCGDVITFPLRGRVHVIEVLALARRRGPPAEARTLYREILPETAPPSAAAQQVSCEAG
jgi:ribosome-associated heat shock protein Hsp15